MKKGLVLFVCLMSVFGILSVLPCNAQKISAQALCRSLEECAPMNYDYADNTAFFRDSFFSSLKNIDDCYIVTSCESTNFNEIGVFHMENRNSVKQNEMILRDYLSKARKRFESGVIYNAREYPKFQNATVFSTNEYLVYTILDRKSTAQVKAFLSQMQK